MPTPTKQGTRPQQQAAPPPAVPFTDGGYEFTLPTVTRTYTPGATAIDDFMQIPPNGYLKGVLITVSGTGGVIGTGTLNADFPYNIFRNLNFQSIDGTNILYPMGGYAYSNLVPRYTQPWTFHPSQDPSFNATLATPFLRFWLPIEVRTTLGVVANTDARAQYQLLWTIETFANLASGATTAPTLTVSFTPVVYPQPPDHTLSGQLVQPVPDGVVAQHFIQHQTGVGGSLTGGTQVVQSQRLGNLVRNLIIVIRNSSGVRTDLASDPIRFQLDTTNLGNETRNYRDWKMFADNKWNALSQARPTGVYVWERYQQKGDMYGRAWLETTEATYLALELNGTPAGGSCEIITEDLALQGPLPAYLQNI